MSSGAGPTLAHRSVASIRGTSHSSQSPSTPSRPISTTYGSPSTLRADEDVIIIELGTRKLRIGFAGDAAPKAVLQFGPDDQRRVGDFRAWQGPRQAGASWADEHEIWQFDLRRFDLGLFQDRIERLLRDAFSRYLLIDSRPRRLGLILDPAAPVPLLAAMLNTMFNKFQTPVVSLMSPPIMSTVAAGVRSALVIDMGWTDTKVTSVYEYREVKCTRSIRAGRLLHDIMYTDIRSLMVVDITADNAGKAISFEECEDIMCRLLWCRPSASRSSERKSAQLETVEEEQEESDAKLPPDDPKNRVKVPLNSANPPSTIEIPTRELADLIDSVLFAPKYSHEQFDDEELPLPLLVYKHLLQLPTDVRAVCMSRVVFTGGCSNILGIKERIIDELAALVDKRGWEPVTGKGAEEFRSNPNLDWRSSALPFGILSSSSSSASVESETKSPQSAAHTVPERDPIEAKVQRSKKTLEQLQGEFRVLHSLGPWAGASILCQLKVPAMAVVDRETWLQQGANGASRANEVDFKSQQRQSMSTGGYIRGSGSHHGNWTLGPWGYL